MSKEQLFFEKMRNEIKDINKGDNLMTGLINHIRKKQKEMQRLETIEELKEKGEYFPQRKRLTKENSRNLTTPRNLALSSDFPGTASAASFQTPSSNSCIETGNQQKSRYMSQIFNTISIAQMSQQFKEESTISKPKKIGQYFEYNKTESKGRSPDDTI